jgi:hypothetical protein
MRLEVVTHEPWPPLDLTAADLLRRAALFAPGSPPGAKARVWSRIQSRRSGQAPVDPAVGDPAKAGFSARIL